VACRLRSLGAKAWVRAPPPGGAGGGRRPSRRNDHCGRLFAGCPRLIEAVARSLPRSPRGARCMPPRSCLSADGQGVRPAPSCGRPGRQASAKGFRQPARPKARRRPVSHCNCWDSPCAFHAGTFHAGSFEAGAGEDKQVEPRPPVETRDGAGVQVLPAPLSRCSCEAQTSRGGFFTWCAAGDSLEAGILADTQGVRGLTLPACCCRARRSLCRSGCACWPSAHPLSSPVFC
jgi:hypothetical protein